MEEPKNRMLTEEHIIEKYFSAFNDKDIVSLEQLLDPNVSLEDWDGNFYGLNEVIITVSRVFAKFPQLKIDTRGLAFSNNHASAEISIQLDDTNFIKVVDIFELKDGKIYKIRAYKC